MSESLANSAVPPHRAQTMTQGVLVGDHGRGLRSDVRFFHGGSAVVALVRLRQSTENRTYANNGDPFVNKPFVASGGGSEDAANCSTLPLHLVP